MIVDQQDSPLGLRTLYTLQGSKEALEGVTQWANDTWGADDCEKYDLQHRASKNKPRRVRIYRYRDIISYQKVRIYLGPGSPPDDSYRMTVALWGKSQSAFFKLRWA